MSVQAIEMACGLAPWEGLCLSRYKILDKLLTCPPAKLPVYVGDPPVMIGEDGEVSRLPGLLPRKKKLSVGTAGCHVQTSSHKISHTLAL